MCTFANFVAKVYKYVGIAFILLAHSPWRHSASYDYVKVEEILKELEILSSVTETDNLTDPKKCPYENVIKDNREMSRSNVLKAGNFKNPNIGGEYTPKNCSSYYKSAILVPYRNRSQHLHFFINYMHSFLQNQYVSYRIFVIEQNDSSPFNRAKLLNVGASEAIKSNYSCLIMNDVDLLPLNTGNIYACSKSPRHMCSSLDTFRRTFA